MMPDRAAVKFLRPEGDGLIVEKWVVISDNRFCGSTKVLPFGTFRSMERDTFVAAMMANQVQEARKEGVAVHHIHGGRIFGEVT